jgi:hypothetical protein
MINLTKTYRTAEGNRVRALHEAYRPKRVFINNEFRNTGHHERVLEGQVYMYDDTSEKIEWCDVMWNEHGYEIYGNEHLDLQEYHEPKVNQPKLFY